MNDTQVPRTEIYGAVHEVYPERGWPSPVPIPAGRKEHPPRGFTGWDGVDPSAADRFAWGDEMPEANVALRMPDGVVGIDVDAYDGRTGAESLDEAQRRWGRLPRAPMSTSRASGRSGHGFAGSGIRFYRVPSGTILRNAIAFPERGIGNIEIVQRHHRYAVVWPSFHPEGRPYGWFAADGTPLDQPPSPEELPWLPTAWCEALAGTGYQCEAACPEQVAEFLAALPEGAPCQAVGRRLNAAVLALGDPVGSRHDDTLGHVLALLRLAEQGHPGVVEALDHLRGEFVAVVTADGSRSKAGAEAEFERMAQGQRGVGLIQTTPTDPLDLGCRCPGIHGQNGHNLAVEFRSTGSEHSGHGFAGSWDDEPADLGRSPAPLPVEAMGPILGPQVRAVAATLQVPTDLAASVALPVITTAAQGRWKVEVQPGWTEVVAVATVSALHSGERKSAAVKLMVDPLKTYEREIQANARVEIARAEAEHRLKQDRADRLRKDAVKAASSTHAEGLYLDAEQAAAGHVVPALPQLLADDVTSERLASIMAAQGGAVGVISPEPTLFAILAGRYTNGTPNVEKVLQGTSGDAFQIDRQGREPVIVDHPALSMGICIQPGLLADLGRTTFRRSGLLARYGYVVPAPLVGTRSDSAEPLSEGIAQAWADHVKALAKHARTIEQRRTLKLTPEALAELNVFRRELEPQLHPHHGRLAELADWGSKLPGLVVRIAAALTLLSDPDAGEVSAKVVADAVRLGRGYIDHARAAFGLVHDRDDVLYRAREVRGWLVHRRQAVISLREIYRALRGRQWIDTANDLRNVLAVLVDYGHLRRFDHAPGTVGRPSEVYELHPSLLT